MAFIPDFIDDPDYDGDLKKYTFTYQLEIIAEDDADAYDQLQLALNEHKKEDVLFCGNWFMEER